MAALTIVISTLIHGQNLLRGESPQGSHAYNVANVKMLPLPISISNSGLRAEAILHWIMADCIIPQFHNQQDARFTEVETIGFCCATLLGRTVVAEGFMEVTLRDVWTVVLGGFDFLTGAVLTY